uniref:Uncharacterized protein n=1 Tax=Anopheles maculatus TaxID=74869 RepID=A0A182SG30_9DIPT
MLPFKLISNSFDGVRFTKLLFFFCVSKFTAYLGVKLYKMERPCAMLGGMCVQTSECKSRPGKEGLCPENGHLGVDCCYEVKPAKNLTCHEYRGACMDRCAEGLQRPSVDCADGQMCCVLVG